MTIARSTTGATAVPSSSAVRPLLIGLSALASACGNGGNQGPSGTTTPTTSPVTTSVSPTEKSINPTGGNVFPHGARPRRHPPRRPVTTTTASGLAAVLPALLKTAQVVRARRRHARAAFWRAPRPGCAGGCTPARPARRSRPDTRVASSGGDATDHPGTRPGTGTAASASTGRCRSSALMVGTPRSPPRRWCAADVPRPGGATTVAVEAGHRVVATRFQVATEHIAISHGRHYRLRAPNAILNGWSQNAPMIAVTHQTAIAAKTSGEDRSEIRRPAAV